MGLAASQARFLAITSRKLNCEFRSMQIAQQKLSVTRDMQKASQDYQHKLSATKLIWEDMDANVYDLSYEMMMTPSAINQYDPYLVTDTQGKIVLTKAMFKAAVDAGIIDENTGNPTGNFTAGPANAEKDGSRNAFLNQLGAKNQIDGSTAAAIMNMPDSYTKSGVGGKILDKSIADALPTTAFINYLGKTYKDFGAQPPNDVSEDTKMYKLNLYDGLFKDNSGLELYSNRFKQNDVSDLSLTDIINGNYVIYHGTMGSTSVVDVAKSVLTKVAELLGMNNASEQPKGLNVDSESASALSQAFQFTFMNYNSSNKVHNSSDKSGAGDFCDVVKNRNDIINGKNANEVAFSLTNMVKSFLTNFAIALEGFDSGFDVNKDDSLKSKYVTDDYNYYFLLKAGASTTDNTALNADFYNMLYNQICANGASTDETKQQLVTDKEYLSHALKNGQLFISSLNNDGYFYQGPYTLNGHVAEVPDENARAQAELEYNVTKGKLNYKEETLDLEMKNLDMEISALSTEYDTVKNLISKGVEKVFAMFSS